MSKPNKFSRRDGRRFRRVSWSQVKVWRCVMRNTCSVDPALAFDYAYGGQGVTMPWALWRRRTI